MVYHHYYKPSRVYYQQGHGLGSLIARFALPALRKLAPIVKSAVKTHGKRVIRKVGRAALKSAQAKNKKAVFKREMAALPWLAICITTRHLFNIVNNTLVELLRDPI